jgi:hypothetical protein
MSSAPVASPMSCASRVTETWHALNPSLSSETRISRICWGQLNLFVVGMGCYVMRFSVFGAIDLRDSYLPRSIWSSGRAIIPRR